MKDLKITWKYFWEDDDLKSDLTDFASRLISFDEFNERVASSPQRNRELAKLKQLPEESARHRAQCALNAHGTPVSGMRQYVDKYPIP